MVVAGGGGSSLYALGAGGAGGFRMSTALPVSVATYPVTIGGGGTGAIPSGPSQGLQGGNSIFSTITSSGGGGGGNFPTPGPVTSDGSAGGSGGGIGRDAYLAGRTSANNGNLPSVSPSQGNPGGVYAYGPGGTQGAAGGGGASASGNPGPGNGAGPGGAGSPAAPVFGAAPKAYYQANNPLNGPTSTGIFAGGGGSASYPCGSGGGTGGPGGGGNGKPSPGNGNNGLANTGGGGGASFNSNSGSGGSGVVLIRYKYQ